MYCLQVSAHARTFQAGNVIGCDSKRVNPSDLPEVACGQSIHIIGHSGVNHSQHLYILSDIQVSAIPHTDTYCRTYRCCPFPTHILTVGQTAVTHSPHLYTLMDIPVSTIHSPHPYTGHCPTYRCQPSPTPIHRPLSYIQVQFTRHSATCTPTSRISAKEFFMS